jgi:hypothetical protein
VQTVGNFAGEKIVHDPVPLDPAPAPEDFRRHRHPHVGGLARHRPGMAGVEAAFIDYFEVDWREPARQGIPNALDGSHIKRLRRPRRARQRDGKALALQDLGAR